jgi:hypothetical protein
MNRLSMALMPVGTEYQQIFINGTDLAANIKKGGLSVLGQDPVSKGVLVQVTFLVDDLRVISAYAPGTTMTMNRRGAEEGFTGCGTIVTEMGEGK